ncbi:LOW QUALITY PROTEIN: Protein cubitus interruptus [Frankliniella fusca]|uniref:Protein cubitus interruptus n=1 Tax=Frankliniella fusca TaxID=407009 RepID=A0AAE1HHQ2_9NEOP|nr:LOW QUALITY PROTEIN: Protein cubitus interruptus [Frankliniella fusca]
MDVKHTGDLLCGTCQTGEIYIGTIALNRHYKRRHHQLSVYVCGQLGCRKGYRDLTSMIRHITTVHKVIFEGENQELPDQADNSSSMDASFEEEDVNDNEDDAISAPLGEDDFVDEEEGTMQEKLNRAAVKVLLRLRSKASLTGAAVERFEKGCYEMIKQLCVSIKQSVTVRLNEKGMSDEDAEYVLSEVNSLTDPFKNLKTIDDQLKYYEEHYGLVKPTQKVLDTRIDKRLDPSTNCQVPTQVLETFQYVSLIDTLKFLLKNKKFRDCIFKKQQGRNDNVLRSYADGEHFKNHPYLQRHEGVIQLILFFDELEIANSLGSKTIIHKLAAFFVLNLPSELSSELASIFLVALAHADDLKKKGAMEKVLAPLIHELKKLAVGIDVEFGKEKFCLRPLLVILTADTLAAHDILGFLGPGAKHFCRRCMIPRGLARRTENVEGRQPTDSEDSSHPSLLVAPTAVPYADHGSVPVRNANAIGELRTCEEHQRQVELITARPNLLSEFGVKKSCPLNEAPYFDCTSSSVFDAFHDVLEGVVPLDIKLVIRHFIFVENLFTVKDLNHRIASFSYGIPDSKNNPSANFTADMLTQSGGKLKQTGSQMWCLMRSLPFLIGDYVPEGSPHMKLIITL